MFCRKLGGTGWTVGDHRTHKAYQNGESESILQQIINEHTDLFLLNTVKIMNL